jgi:outer membrane protein
MSRVCGLTVIMLCMLAAKGLVFAQTAPPVPERSWNVSLAKRPFTAPPRPAPALNLDPEKVYTLSELVDAAEKNNPETRVAWENAKARAAELGIARSSLYPTLAAAALAGSGREDVFLGSSFYRQTRETFSPVFGLNYIIFDFGQRSQEISIRKDDLLAANFKFNDKHRTIIFQVMEAYYRLLDSEGQEDAAEANLKNAETVRQASEARLQNGLATLPDVLEARSAAAQAEYDLQAVIGATEIAHGDLATALGISPITKFHVQSIQEIKIADSIPDTVEDSIDRALLQRPDLMQLVAKLRAAGAEIKAARSTYFPTLSVDGRAGLERTYGDQIGLAGAYSPTQETWDAALTLKWTLFDGLARENRLAKAHADEKEASASVDSSRDQVENQVWAAYSTVRTALRQQKAAAALLEAATESYNAALESYNYGVRTQIDVVSAQRELASARTADIDARTKLLTGLAALAYQTGDLLQGKHP